MLKTLVRTSFDKTITSLVCNNDEFMIIGIRKTLVHTRRTNVLALRTTVSGDQYNYEFITSTY